MAMPATVASSDRSADSMRNRVRGSSPGRASSSASASSAIGPSSHADGRDGAATVSAPMNPSPITASGAVCRRGRPASSAAIAVTVPMQSARKTMTPLSIGLGHSVVSSRSGPSIVFPSNPPKPLPASSPVTTEPTSTARIAPMTRNANRTRRTARATTVASSVGASSSGTRSSNAARRARRGRGRADRRAPRGRSTSARRAGAGAPCAGCRAAGGGRWRRGRRAASSRPPRRGLQ